MLLSLTIYHGIAASYLKYHTCDLSGKVDSHLLSFVFTDPKGYINFVGPFISNNNKNKNMQSEEVHKWAIGILTMLIVIWVFSSRPDENKSIKWIFSKLMFGLGPNFNANTSSSSNKKPTKNKVLQKLFHDNAILLGDHGPCKVDQSPISILIDNDIPPEKYIAGARAIAGKSFKMGDTVAAFSELESPQSENTTFSLYNDNKFNVRVGPDYARYGRKAPSLSALYESIGVDIMRSDCIINHVAPHLLFPSAPDYYDPACKLPALLVINIQLPLAMPSLFSSPDDDPGWSCITYFMIKKETVNWVLNKNTSTDTPTPPALKIFERLLDKGYSEPSLALKALGIVHDLENQDLPMKNIMQKYNGKPALVTASAKFHFGQSPYSYLEIDYNVRKWSILFRTSLVQFGDALKALTCHIGYLVEATDDGDLPERMLGVVTVHNLSVENARWVDFDDEE